MPQSQRFCLDLTRVEPFRLPKWPSDYTDYTDTGFPTSWCQSPNQRDIDPDLSTLQIDLSRPDLLHIMFENAANRKALIIDDLRSGEVQTQHAGLRLRAETSEHLSGS